MQDIQQQVIATYQKNLEYLQQHHCDLHNKLIALETALASEQYNERYSLEYKEGYFDVLEISSGDFLYGENSLLYSQQIVDMTDFRKTGGVFQAQKYADFSPEMPDIIDKSELHFHNALWATAKIIEYSKLHASKTTTSMHTIYKNIFIGSGLGLHIPEICHKLHTKIAFIQENNLELFRLSLFVTDYAKLSKDVKLFFSIMDNESEERLLFVNFLEMGNNYNLYLKHIPFIKNYEPKLSNFQTHLLSQPHISYGYSAILLCAVDAPRYLAQNYAFIDLSRRYDNTIFSNKPVLFLFSGPSTGKNIEWIQANHHRFIIATALSTCRLLQKYDILPDIVFHIDPGQKQTEALFEGLDTKKIFQNSFCIFSSNVDPHTVNKFDRNRIYFIEHGSQYKQGFEELTAPSVGEYAYAVALLFGTTNLFLLGLDQALDPETLQSHSSMHPYSVTGSDQEDDSVYNYTTAYEYVRGNFLPMVPTLVLYKLSIQELNRFTRMMKRKTQNVYNLGNGAYFEQTVPLPMQNQDWTFYPPLNRAEVTTSLKDFFDTISSNEFRAVDKNILQYQIQEAKKLLFLITKHKKQKSLSTTSYLDSIAKLSWALSDMKSESKSYLAEVYYDYFKTVLSYIFDLFNTKELENPTQHIKAIDTILVAQLEKMGNLFVNKLEEYLK